jgi:hypothetical protein
MEARTPHIEATPEGEREVRRRGGLLFVWPKHHGGRFGGVTCCGPPRISQPRLLEYRRVRVGRILVLLSPRLRRLPSKLELALTGWRRRRIAAYWDGCAFAM